jgi:very-short-patch-repair endonuclease
VATRQLLEIGFTMASIGRMVEKSWLVPVHRGVYAVGHRRLTERGIWMAAVLACGSSALLSHRSAAALWGIGADSSVFTEVLATKSGRPHDRVLVHRARSIHAHDRAVRDAIPVTSVPRTLLDLADVVNPRRLERAFEEADRLRLLDGTELQRLLERANGRRNRHRLAALHAQFRPAPHTRSELERRFIDLIRDGGLPEPLVNANVMGYEVDMLWPEPKVIVELDGYAFHAHRAAFERDSAKRARLATAGFAVVPVTWRRLKDEPQRIVGELGGLVRP